MKGLTTNPPDEVSIPWEVLEFLKRAIQEDVGPGDITTLSIVPFHRISKARIIAKSDMVIAGLPFVKELFRLYDPSVDFRSFFIDGQRLSKGDIVAEISGKARSLLFCERTGLNILQRLSGIATLTRRFVEEIEGTGAKILDTRKTTPLMRYLEKYAVRIGGGYNHRMGLYDGVLIKDNHIKIAGGIKKAVELIKNSKIPHHLLKIEVEVKNLDEVREAIEAGVHVIMLDNMDIDDIKKAVGIIRDGNPSIIIEASGNVSLKNVRLIAEAGVDFISIGSLTHSAVASDLSMKIIE